METVIDQSLIDSIDAALQVQMKKSRYRHTQGVLNVALHLAVKYGANPHHTAVAALFHDYAKDFSRERLFQLIFRYQLETDPIMDQAHQLLHGKVAAAIALHEYGIQEPEVLLAIENHTTGRVHMGLLEKIIYLSDFIEPGRDYPGVESLRKLAEENLNQAVYQALTNTMIYVLRTGKLLHPKTLEARNQMMMEEQVP